MTPDLYCPYCGEGNEVCHDDGAGYDEDQKHEMECTDCGMSFVFTTAISFHYEPQKADCLNGARHSWKPTMTVPVEYTRMSCTECGGERQPTFEELEAAKSAQERKDFREFA